MILSTIFQSTYFQSFRTIGLEEFTLKSSLNLLARFKKKAWQIYDKWEDDAFKLETWSILIQLTEKDLN